MPPRRYSLQTPTFTPSHCASFLSPPLLSTLQHLLTTFHTERSTLTPSQITTPHLPPPTLTQKHTHLLSRLTQDRTHSESWKSVLLRAAQGPNSAEVSTFIKDVVTAGESTHESRIELFTVADWDGRIFEVLLSAVEAPLSVEEKGLLFRELVDFRSDGYSTTSYYGRSPRDPARVVVEEVVGKFREGGCELGVFVEGWKREAGLDVARIAMCTAGLIGQSVVTMRRRGEEGDPYLTVREVLRRRSGWFPFARRVGYLGQMFEYWRNVLGDVLKSPGSPGGSKMMEMMMSELGKNPKRRRPSEDEIERLLKEGRDAVRIVIGFLGVARHHIGGVVEKDEDDSIDLAQYSQLVFNCTRQDYPNQRGGVKGRTRGEEFAHIVCCFDVEQNSFPTQLCANLEPPLRVWESVDWWSLAEENSPMDTEPDETETEESGSTSASGWES